MSVTSILRGQNLFKMFGLFVGVAALIGASIVLLRLPENPSVKLNNTIFSVTVADNSDERERGLSGQSALASDQGMLFIHEAEGKHCYWMKDMKLSIDILWFDNEQELVHAEPNASPMSYPRSFCPTSSARYVLEIPAGSTEKNAFKNGDSLQLINL